MRAVTASLDLYALEEWRGQSLDTHAIDRQHRLEIGLEAARELCRRHAEEPRTAPLRFDLRRHEQVRHLAVRRIIESQVARAADCDRGPSLSGGDFAHVKGLRAGEKGRVERQPIRPSSAGDHLAFGALRANGQRDANA